MGNSVYVYRINDDVFRVGAIAVHTRDREVLANVRLAVLALEALPAVVNRFLDDVIALGELFDAITCLYNDGRVFVTYDPRDRDELVAPQNRYALASLPQSPALWTRRSDSSAAGEGTSRSCVSTDLIPVWTIVFIISAEHILIARRLVKSRGIKIS